MTHGQSCRPRACVFVFSRAAIRESAASLQRICNGCGQRCAPFAPSSSAGPSAEPCARVGAFGRFGGAGRVAAGNAWPLRGRGRDVWEFMAPGTVRAPPRRRDAQEPAAIHPIQPRSGAKSPVMPRDPGLIRGSIVERTGNKPRLFCADTRNLGIYGPSGKAWESRAEIPYIDIGRKIITIWI